MRSRSASLAACSAANTPLWAGTFTAAPAADLPAVTLAPGTSVTLCVSVTLSSTAPNAAQGQPAAPFTVLVDGRQIR